jgi:hypothetical protein
LIIFSEQALTYAHKYKEFSFGLRLKYLQGLIYGSFNNVTGLSSYFTTDSIAFSGKGEFLLEQAIGGSGYAIDFGISNVNPISGWKLGLTLNNLFGQIYWDDSNITYDLLYDNISRYIPLRQNEYQYISMNLDSVNAFNMMNMSADEIFYIENYPVVLLDIENLPDNLPEDTEYIITGNGTYLVNSENLENNFLKTLTPAEQSTNYPTLLSFGANKLIKDDISVCFDLSTNFSNDIRSSKKWKFSTGLLFNRYEFMPITFGLSLGGIDGLNSGFSIGYNKGPFLITYGFNFREGILPHALRGIDMAFSIVLRIKNI